MEQHTSHHSDVLVLGGGAAGLMAARTLSQAGLAVRLLEARDRLGGRMHTHTDPGLPVPIELGAEFVHGMSPELFGLAREANLPLYESAGNTFWSEGGVLEANDREDMSLGMLFEQMAQYAEPDRSFAEFAAPFFADPATHTAAEFATRYVQGFEAAWPERISIQELLREQAAAAPIQGDRAFKLVGGYAGVVRWLQSGLDPARTTIELNSVVARIAWQPGQVTVHTSDGRQFTARHAIITLPLAVLQAPVGQPGAVQFVPPLPAKTAAMQQLEMGQAIRVVLHFRERWWSDETLVTMHSDEPHDRMSFMLSNDAWMPTWWTSYPLLAPVLTGWGGGPVAAQFAGKGDAFIIDHALDALSRVAGVARQQLDALLVAAHTYDWASDPFARGAYSYALVGGVDGHAQLAAPVENTLFFAGEATNSHGHHATVHGALATGTRAANEILQLR